MYVQRDIRISSSHSFLDIRLRDCGSRRCGRQPRGMAPSIDLHGRRQRPCQRTGEYQQICRTSHGSKGMFRQSKTFRELTSLQVYVKALDKEDHLVPVAFLDVPPFITSLKTFKNLLLIGDMVKSVWLAVFQVRIHSKARIRTLVDPLHRKYHSSWMSLARTFTTLQSSPSTFSLRRVA
jgi:hypothetical protein